MPLLPAPCDFCSDLLSFGSPFLLNDVSGTYTVSDHLTFVGISDFGGAAYFASGGPNFSNGINPLSYVTFNQGLITNWAIEGTGTNHSDDVVPLGTESGLLQSISETNNPFGAPVRDYVLELCSSCNGAYAIADPPALGRILIQTLVSPVPSQVQDCPA